MNALQNWLKNSPTRQRWAAALLALLVFGAAFLLSAQTDLAAPLYSLSILLKLAGVLLLIVASAALFLRPMLPSRPRDLRLQESLRLSPRQALHLVQVGGRQFLLGATDQSISLICALPAAEDAPEMEAPLRFDEILQSSQVLR